MTTSGTADARLFLQPTPLLPSLFHDDERHGRHGELHACDAAPLRRVRADDGRDCLVCGGDDVERNGRRCVRRRCPSRQ